MLKQIPLPHSSLTLSAMVLAAADVTLTPSQVRWLRNGDKP
jgi:hypothetical protein